MGFLITRINLLSKEGSIGKSRTFTYKNFEFNTPKQKNYYKCVGCLIVNVPKKKKKSH